MWLYHRVMSPIDAERIANSVDPDQRSSLIWVCTVCPDLSVRKRTKITEVLENAWKGMINRIHELQSWHTLRQKLLLITIIC